VNVPLQQNQEQVLHVLLKNANYIASGIFLMINQATNEYHIIYTTPSYYQNVIHSTFQITQLYDRGYVFNYTKMLSFFSFF